jgi:hypothetical protein
VADPGVGVGFDDAEEAVQGHGDHPVPAVGGAEDAQAEGGKEEGQRQQNGSHDFRDQRE